MAVVNFKGALRTYLLADTPLAALVGVKIYSPAAPQNTIRPYVTIRKISRVTIDNLTVFNSVVEERWQTDSYGSDPDNTEAVAKAVFDRLHMKILETWSGYKIYLSKFDNENDLSESEIEGSENMIDRIQQDFYIKRNYNKI
jgi:hypothetical protein